MQAWTQRQIPERGSQGRETNAARQSPAAPRHAAAHAAVRCNRLIRSVGRLRFAALVVTISALVIANAKAATAAAGDAGQGVPGEQSRWASIYPAAGLSWVSDYRFNGTSNSDASPALQGFVHFIAPDGWYLGAFASEVDFNDPGDTSVELDVYLGRDFALAGNQARLEVMHLAFDEQVPGPTYDFWQFKARLQRDFDRVTLGGGVTWTPEAPYAGGRQTQLRGDAVVRLGPRWSLVAGAGHGFAAETRDRNYWEIGVEWTWRHVKVGLRWADSDVPNTRCLADDGCNGAVVGSITLQSWRSD